MRQSSYSTYHQVARSPGGARPGPPASLHPFTQQSFSMPAPVSQARPTSPFSALSIWEVGTREDEAIALRMWLESHLVCARPPSGCRLLSQSQSGLWGGPNMIKCQHHV